MLADKSIVKDLVTDAVDALESAGAVSAIDALFNLRDECERRIEFERGRGFARADVIRRIGRHWYLDHSKAGGSNELIAACPYCLDLSVKLKETLP